jgi:hypothetical protein
MPTSPEPVVKNIKVYQGPDFNYSFTYLTGGTGSSPVDLTGYTADFIVKDKPQGTELWRLATDNGGVALGGVSGVVTIQADSTVVSALTWKSGIYEFCLESGTGQRDLILRGSIGLVLF